jgi:aldehyde dehydrogenase (NAD+)
LKSLIPSRASTAATAWLSADGDIPRSAAIDQIYIDGAFVAPHGSERAPLVNPANEAVIGYVTLGDRVDTLAAIAAAKRALPAMPAPARPNASPCCTGCTAVLSRADDINAAATEEYGGPVSRAAWVASYAAESFLNAAKTLEAYPLTRQIGTAEVTMEPVGVAA